ncbi:GTP cyclohydrolase II [Nocardia sp. GAS34]|uniref:GTP cyclohydrolase II n=1 Tax=unclassified Nocardia TaxID=2637762 RepID=UPI003D19F7B1
MTVVVPALAAPAHVMPETVVPAPGTGTEHTFNRHGREIPLRILEIGGDTDHGHLLVFGDPGPDCLVRIHSRCLYGESLGSDDCDCGPELDKALDMIQDAGAGVLIYLEQEGRGAGLLAKARGYRHSEQYGADTFASYEALGYPADARSYTVAVEHLRVLLDDLGVRAIQLLTNNPDKARAVREAGIAVSVLPLATAALSARASDYLEAKRRRRRHWIPTAEAPWAPEPR